jgi:hypothetical protein
MFPGLNFLRRVFGAGKPPKIRRRFQNPEGFETGSPNKKDPPSRPNAVQKTAFRRYCGSLMLYFFLNRSMRPAVSTSFCLPVKKGWQAEQISTLMSFTVERVSITFPQAQVIVVSSYLG